MPPGKQRGRPSSCEEAASRKNVELAKDQRHLSNLNVRPAQELRDGKDVLIARGRLADARRWFAHRGWDALPRGARGERILAWGAHHAWLASPANPERSVRRWCRKWAPTLTDDDLDRIVVETRTSNKRWSHDQSAAVLEIRVHDRSLLRFRFLGACDDPNFEIRLGIKREKAAARARAYRAARATGRTRGRPRREGLEPWQAAGASSKAAYYRNVKKARAMGRSETQNSSRHLSNNKKRDAILVSPPSASTSPDAIELAVFDFAKFGILAVTIMLGRATISEWRRRP